MSTLPICTKCGSEAKEDAIFCPSCGEKLGERFTRTTHDWVYCPSKHSIIDLTELDWRGGPAWIGRNDGSSPNNKLVIEHCPSCTHRHFYELANIGKRLHVNSKTHWYFGPLVVCEQCGAIYHTNEEKCPACHLSNPYGGIGQSGEQPEVDRTPEEILWRRDFNPRDDLIKGRKPWKSQPSERWGPEKAGLLITTKRALIEKGDYKGKSILGGVGTIDEGSVVEQIPLGPDTTVSLEKTHFEERDWSVDWADSGILVNQAAVDNPQSPAMPVYRHHSGTYDLVVHVLFGTIVFRKRGDSTPRLSFTLAESTPDNRRSYDGSDELRAVFALALAICGPLANEARPTDKTSDLALWTWHAMTTPYCLNCSNRLPPPTRFIELSEGPLIFECPTCGFLNKAEPRLTGLEEVKGRVLSI